MTLFGHFIAAMWCAIAIGFLVTGNDTAGVIGSLIMCNLWIMWVESRRFKKELLQATTDLIRLPRTPRNDL
jgi:hypothetical protein